MKRTIDHIYSKQHLILFFIVMFMALSSYTQNKTENIIREYPVPESRQAVAIDGSHFYVINNSSITKHNKSDGELVHSWYDKDSVLHHMNSGIIIDNKLYCCNSNYPESPMASSIEIFHPETLNHIDNHSFGILNGSATWLDRYQGYWYVAFAHYTDRGSEPGKDNSWTRLVKFDDDWRQLESWIFPPELTERFASRSNSGGVILEDGRILCTGHDNFEIYVLVFPGKGYTLKWHSTLPVGSYGQGIAYEKNGNSELIWGIIKKDKKVVVTKID